MAKDGKGKKHYTVSPQKSERVSTTREPRTVRAEEKTKSLSPSMKDGMATVKYKRESGSGRVKKTHGGQPVADTAYRPYVKTVYTESEPGSIAAEKMDSAGNTPASVAQGSNKTVGLQDAAQISSGNAHIIGGDTRIAEPVQKKPDNPVRESVSQGPRYRVHKGAVPETNQRIPGHDASGRAALGVPANAREKDAGDITKVTYRPDKGVSQRVPGRKENVSYIGPGLTPAVDTKAEPPQKTAVSVKQDTVYKSRRLKGRMIASANGEAVLTKPKPSGAAQHVTAAQQVQADSKADGVKTVPAASPAKAQTGATPGAVKGGAISATATVKTSAAKAQTEREGGKRHEAQTPGHKTRGDEKAAQNTRESVREPRKRGGKTAGAPSNADAKHTGAGDTKGKDATASRERASGPIRGSTKKSSERRGGRVRYVADRVGHGASRGVQGSIKKAGRTGRRAVVGALQKPLHADDSWEDDVARQATRPVKRVGYKVKGLSTHVAKKGAGAGYRATKHVVRNPETVKHAYVTTRKTVKRAGIMVRKAGTAAKTSIRAAGKVSSTTIKTTVRSARVITQSAVRFTARVGAAATQAVANTVALATKAAASTVHIWGPVALVILLFVSVFQAFDGLGGMHSSYAQDDSAKDEISVSTPLTRLNLQEAVVYAELLGMGLPDAAIIGIMSTMTLSNDPMLPEGAEYTEEEINLTKWDFIFPTLESDYKNYIKNDYPLRQEPHSDNLVAALEYFKELYTGARIINGDTNSNAENLSSLRAYMNSTTDPKEAAKFFNTHFPGATLKGDDDELLRVVEVFMSKMAGTPYTGGMAATPDIVREKLDALLPGIIWPGRDDGLAWRDAETEKDFIDLKNLGFYQHITIEAYPQHHILVHKDLVDTIQKIFHELKAINFDVFAVAGVDHFEPSYGRFYKTKDGRRLISQHSFGVALDLNWGPANPVYAGPQNPNERGYITRQVVEIFNKYGFYWGGDWSADPYQCDYPHFSYTGY